jgi:two-component system LytT family response regulator
MKLRAIIVDDEPLAREGVEMALGRSDDVEIVASCGDGGSAIRAIRELRPDLVLLDIKLPGLTGFDVIEAVGAENMPAVIFLTAYEEHALRAFRVNAVDYLLKPVSTEHLLESVARARRKIAQDNLVERSEQLRGLLEDAHRAHGREPPLSPLRDGLPERVMVRTVGRVHLLDPREITRVEAARDQVTVYARGDAHVVRDSIKGMERQLAGRGFQRVHRSHLVNLAHIRELVLKDSGDYRVVLADGTSLPVGRNYRDALYAALESVRGPA